MGARRRASGNVVVITNSRDIVCREVSTATLSMWNRRCALTHTAVMCWLTCMVYEWACSSACNTFAVRAVGVGRMPWSCRKSVRRGLDKSTMCGGWGAEGVNLTLCRSF